MQPKRRGLLDDPQDKNVNPLSQYSGFVPYLGAMSDALMGQPVGRQLAQIQSNQQNQAFRQHQAEMQEQHRQAAAGRAAANQAEGRRRWEEEMKLRRQKLAAGPTPTAMMRNYRMSQQDPNFAKFLDGRKPQTNVTVNSGERSYDKELGKQNAKMFIQSQQAGSKAQASLNNLRVLEKAAADPNIYTGAGGTIVQDLKKTAQSFGVKVKGVGSAELIESLSKEIAVNNKDKLPGPMSNSDRQFLVDMAPSLSKTPEGNRLIIGLGILSKNYEIARAKAVRDYAQANGGRLDAGVYQILGQVDAQYQGQFTGLMGQLKSVPEAKPRSPLAGIPSVTSAEQWNSLQPGQQYRDPNGQIRTKQ